VTNTPHSVNFYGSQYGQFASQLYAEIRSDAFGDDIGQNGWLTSDEQDTFISWLALTPKSRLLDVACGSGGPTLRIAGRVGCHVHGIDVHEQAIVTARARSEAEGLTARATFERVDATVALPLGDSSFDALICVDAINHLANRERVLDEWRRVLRPGGHLTFTDPVVVTGPLTNEEIAIRSSIGFFLFVPSGADERLLASAGFEVLAVVDRTENMAHMAARWRDARQRREGDLRRVEGDAAFDGQQQFLRVAAQLAVERRLSRLAFHCRTARCAGPRPSAA
jgi:2-polyprenyl-3-methyl-5-hydroxy-6-metoxy-1,4-benzoquinol methylase